MPRSSSDRKFGFRKKGLVRILLAADALQVKLALDELGLLFENGGGILQSLKDLFDDIFGPIFAVRAIIKQILDRVLGPVGFPRTRTQVAQLSRQLETADDDVRILITAVRSLVNTGTGTVVNKRAVIQIGNALLSDILNSQRILREAGANINENTNAAEALQRNLKTLEDEQDQKRVDFERRIEEAEGQEGGTTSVI